MLQNIRIKILCFFDEDLTCTGTVGTVRSVLILWCQYQDRSCKLVLSNLESYV